MPITDQMVEAGCKANHTPRAWNKAVRNPEMKAWVHSQRQIMRNVLAMAFAADDRDPSEIWEAYLTEVPRAEDRSLQGALAFGYAVGRTL
jgi:hypothetical protein